MTKSKFISVLIILGLLGFSVAHAQTNRELEIKLQDSLYRVIVLLTKQIEYLQTLLLEQQKKIADINKPTLLMPTSTAVSKSPQPAVPTPTQIQGSSSCSSPCTRFAPMAFE